MHAESFGEACADASLRGQGGRLKDLQFFTVRRLGTHEESPPSAVVQTANADFLVGQRKLTLAAPFYGSDGG